MNANQIRQTFLDFFAEKSHAIVPSAPMVVKNDPTLMFTNAGMNQFKDIFLGNQPVKYPRVADTQKCLRVSGKHNDLEEVGHDTYHHTMFEMLGNWSFGDYFKKEAIEWAWELLTERFKLDTNRIYATIFEGAPDEGVPRDDEAYNLWLQFLPAERILTGNKKDNFWEMGETGPCGPCSEIHFDLRADADRAAVDGATLVNKDNPLVIEIWNLVFMQFNRKVGGALEPLPAQHVDTGMGFERLCMVVQGKQSNYDTDVFQPLIQRLAALSSEATGAALKYGDDIKKDIAMRVIADHLRAISFSIADGQLPSNVKAGYVIRRILRRAVRYGYTYLGFNEPFICRLVPALAEQMGGQFPELKAQQGLIERVIAEEEGSFLRTLATGIGLLDSIIKKNGGKRIGGTDAFTLYDTYGFPIDLTQLIASEQGVAVDIEGFEKELEAQKNRSRNAAAIETDDWAEVMPIDESRFVGYDHTEYPVRIARYRRVSAKGKTYYQLVFDYTPFYGNSGGQVGDQGWIEAPGGGRTAITDTQKENNLTVHIAPELPADLRAEFRAVVDLERRRATECNHTATHLMHHALRAVLGTHVEQKGSLVTPESLRFDFSHFQKLTDEELREVEHLVNRAIRANTPADEHRELPIAQAEKMGAMMLFGEKYGEAVRVVRYGESIELCGGTHVGATGEIGLFKIVSEGSSAAGIRRIEAVTAAAAENLFYHMEDAFREFRRIVGSDQVVQALQKIVAENADMQQQVDAMRLKIDNELVDRMLGEPLKVGNYYLISARLDMPAESMKYISFEIAKRLPESAVVFGSDHGGKPLLSVSLGQSVVGGLGLNAGNIVREAAKLMQGGGGGQPHYATAGGKDSDGLNAAVNAAADAIREKMA